MEFKYKHHRNSSVTKLTDHAQLHVAT